MDFFQMLFWVLLAIAFPVCAFAAWPLFKRRRYVLALVVMLPLPVVVAAVLWIPLLEIVLAIGFIIGP